MSSIFLFTMYYNICYTSFFLLKNGSLIVCFHIMMNDFFVFIDEVFHDDQDLLQMERFIDNCFS